jgi:uncharacterized protein YlxW (UPF0749 family)
MQIQDRSMDKATQTLLEQGIIGVLLFLAVSIIIALLYFGMKSNSKQLLDKDREILRLQKEVEEMRRNFRESIEGAIDRCDNSIRSSERAMDDNTETLNEIRLILIKILESKL